MTRFDVAEGIVVCPPCGGVGRVRTCGFPLCESCNGTGAARCEACARPEAYRLLDGLPVCRRCGTCPCGDQLAAPPEPLSVYACPACEPFTFRRCA